MKEGTVDQIRTVRRADLQQRFRGSAADVTLEELLQLTWPKATEEDFGKMRRWVQLMEAQRVLREPNFRGETSDLRRIFDLLDVNGDGDLSLKEVLRANILTKSEVVQLLGPGKSTINFTEFVGAVQPHFRRAKKEQEGAAGGWSKMEQEEAQQASDEKMKEFKGLVDDRRSRATMRLDRALGTSQEEPHVSRAVHTDNAVKRRGSFTGLT